MVFVLVGLVALGVVGAAHWYLWRRLVRDTTSEGSPWRRVGAAAFVALPLAMIAAQVSARSDLPFVLKQTLAWPGFLWAALLLYLLLALAVAELVRPVLLRVLARRAAAREAEGASRPADDRAEGDAAARPVPAAAPAGVAAAEHPAPPSADAPAAEGPDRAPEAPAPAAGLHLPSRRLFVSRVVGGAAALAAAGTVAYGTSNVLSGPTVKRVTVPLAKLPRSAHGYRIAVVSDIHLGPVLGRAHTQRIVDTINATGPDLVAVVGDLVDGTVADLGTAAEPLAGLRARHGSFFVTGNHEYYSGVEEWVDHVRELGLRPLRNERVEIPGFDLAGVNDVSGEDHGDAPDYGRALGDRDPGRASVLLAHQPVMIHEAVEHGVDLQLSGHTHGGQMWPLNYVAAAANPTLEGLDRYGDTQLYVTRGAGAWGPPVRVGAPADITVVQLASRQA
ncbi:metallophosphoesterase [Streptomyces sp. NPDC060194]|uniref:metallophosphoesterase n=1 Tax=Streptomyces sp. NPDC060194 TaxID=3347069 RepID=UPI00364AF35D